MARLVNAPLTADGERLAHAEFVGGATLATLKGSGDISIADAGRVEELVDGGSRSVGLGR